MRDALENFFDRDLVRISREDLTVAAVRDFIEVAAVGLDVRQQLPWSEDVVRVAFGKISAADLWHPKMSSDFRARVAAAVLYADEVVLGDPVARYVTVARSFIDQRGGLTDRDIEPLWDAIKTLVSLEPLLATQAIRLEWPSDEDVGAWPTKPGSFIYDAIAPSYRSIPVDEYDSITQNDMPLVEALAAAIVVVRHMAWARATRSHMLVPEPQLEQYADVLRQHLETAGAARELDIWVVNALTHTTLPSVADLDVKTLAAVRDLDDDLAEWRAALRVAVRGVHSIPASERVEAIARNIDDVMQPAAAAARRSASSWKAVGEKTTIRLSVGAIGGAGSQSWQARTRHWLPDLRRSAPWPVGSPTRLSASVHTGPQQSYAQWTAGRVSGSETSRSGRADANVLSHSRRPPLSTHARVGDRFAAPALREKQKR